MGIDLAWGMDPPREGGTGICLVDEGGRPTFLAVTSMEEILETIPEGDCWVAVDAPLSVPNERGYSDTERELRSMGIRVMPTSRTFMRRFGGCRGEMLAERSAEIGFSFTRNGRWITEAYPHGTLSVLLPGRVPRYKRGRREERETATEEVLEAVRCFEPSLEVPTGLRDASSDLVDALLCVACIYSHWINGGRTTQIIGKGIDLILPRGAVH